LGTALTKDPLTVRFSLDWGEYPDHQEGELDWLAEKTGHEEEGSVVSLAGRMVGHLFSLLINRGQLEISYHQLSERWRTGHQYIVVRMI
jgi:hypothetical protein